MRRKVVHEPVIHLEQTQEAVLLRRVHVQLTATPLETKRLICAERLDEVFSSETNGHDVKVSQKVVQRHPKGRTQRVGLPVVIVLSGPSPRLLGNQA